MNVYFVPSAEAGNDPEESANSGRRWLTQHQDEGVPFILLIAHNRVDDNAAIHELIDSGVRYGIPKNFPPDDWPGGPVLAPWPDANAIKRLDRRPTRITSVCVLKWMEEDNRDWLTAHEAIDVTDPTRVPLPATIEDGVVLAALEDISSAVNLSTGMTHYRDHQLVISHLKCLKHSNRELIPEEIVSWALANGWAREHTDRLEDTVKRINAGKAFRNIPTTDCAGRVGEWEQRSAQRAS